MRFVVHITVMVVFLSCAALARAQEDEQFVPLFNGQDLDGWVNVNCAPETFTARDEMIVSTGKPTGVMRTKEQYENFILELEWRHMKPQGNAGLFVWSDPITARGVPFTRSLEVQILDGRTNEDYTSHGDIFSIHGASFIPDRPHPKGWARCLPSEHRCNPAGEWNHYRVVCRDGVIKLSVNGKEVSGGTEAMPRKGYICLEAEGSECHFRNIRIAVLPGGNATDEQTAMKDEGFQSLYSGLDLRGWKTKSKSWEAKDWILAWKGGRDRATIASDTKFTEGTFLFDFRWSQPERIGTQPVTTVVNMGAMKVKLLAMRDMGGIMLADFDSVSVVPLGEWNRLEVTLTGGSCSVRLNGEQLGDSFPLEAAAGEISIQPSSAPMEFGNLYVRQAAE